jgi:hypothetical protein
MRTIINAIRTTTVIPPKNKKSASHVSFCDSLNSYLVISYYCYTPFGQDGFPGDSPPVPKPRELGLLERRYG